MIYDADADTEARLAACHGPQRAAAIVAGDDPATTADIEAWNRFGGRPGRARMADIVRAVALASGVSVEDIKGRSKLRPLVRARHEAMAACYAQGLWSLTVVGRFFGRDHTTIIHAIRRVNERAAR